MKEVYDKIYDYCRRDQGCRLDAYLNEVGLIDLLHDDGLFFELALTMDSPTLLNVLLDYYKKYQLVGEERSHEYIIARDKLIDNLRAGVDKYAPLSSEIQKVVDETLERYVLPQDDNDSRQDLGEIGEEWHTSSQDEDSYESGGSSNLTVENLQKLENILAEVEELREGITLSGEGA